MILEKKPLLSVENLSVSFKGDQGEVQAVKNISFILEAGKTLALVGESGSGKSVSSLSILKLLPYPKAFHPSGKIFFEGQDLLSLKDKQLERIRGNDIAMVFQEPLTALNPLQTLERQIKETLDLHTTLTEKEKKIRIIDLLTDVGFPDGAGRLKSFPHEISGGQRQRVMIAMALGANPKILIADEPTTALDVTTQLQILNLIKELKEKYNLAVLLVTHDLNVVKHHADHVAIMRQGELVEQAPTQEIFSNPKQVYTRQLIEAEPKGSAIPLPKSPKTRLVADKVSVHFPIKAGLLKRTVDFVKALNDVSFDLREGETLGVVGESGSGKSTLAMTILRLQRATSGHILLQGTDITKLKGSAIRPLRKNLQIVFQDPFGSLNPRLPVDRIIGEGLHVHNLAKTPQEHDKLIIKAMEEVHLDPKTRHRYPHEFSGGQRQRIAIARALVLNPKVLILDEPTSALDRAVQVSILDLLKELQEDRQMSYIFISHDLKVIQSVAHKIIVMKEGHIVESGSAQEIFRHPKNQYTKTLIQASF
ncbi:MAG: ABC transporter ATP-binding protein [Alphaproteobacteria bacterium]|nr:ABC transporter ATP-binding protein [Alphaproteobacteria bacterium]NCQ67152.1 ABC transporter ATP-binding protein [Alphaproteobacteria bacterium]NCT07748.1 ABC transporter ATP-binding protein [Alphaproteobacteria bacterium]